MEYEKAVYDNGSAQAKTYDLADVKSWYKLLDLWSASGQRTRIFYRDNGSITVYHLPVLLDLNADDHIDLRPFDPEVLAGPSFDWDGDGVSDQTAWVGPEDGFLALDIAADGGTGPDGVIDQARELVFSLWADGEAAGVVSDLEGLRLAFDSTGDNVLDARDRRWDEFRVWQDRNQNGVSDPDELLTLDQAGIRLINLLPSAEGSKLFGDGSEITGTSTLAMADGTSRLVGDASLAFRPSSLDSQAA